MSTYDLTRDAINDVLDARDQARKSSGYGARNGDKWPEWVKLVIAVGTIVVTVTMAYAALDKRMSLLEQKVDYLVQQAKQ